MILNSFRNASHSLIIKILFAAIIFSFCLWGVGDIIRNYSASKTVFSVENTKLSVDQFLREYSQEKQRIRNIGSKPLSDKEMEKLDIKNLVLNKLVNEVVLSQIYNKLGIIVPNKTLIEIVHSLPEFRNEEGNFDERVYEVAIRRSGINEQGFLNQIRDNVARNQLLHPVVAGYKLPKFIEECITKEFESKNTILLSKINLNSVKFNKNITKSELKQYYENNKQKYQRPETRDITVLIIDYRDLAKTIAIDEDTIEKYYSENKNAYKPKEKRDFERFVFDSKEDADKAWDMMNRGVKSVDIIKKLTPNMENVKGVIISDLPVEISKDLFNLKLTRASNVYNISGKYYIYRLTKILEEKGKSEKEIKNQIREELRNEKLNSPEFYSKIKEMKNRIDDGFGSGKTIEEISKETGMKIVNISELEKNFEKSKLADIIKDEDTRTDVMNEIFSTDEGQVTQTIDSKEIDTLSYAVFVKKIKPASIPEFEKIEDKVKNDFILEKKDKLALNKIGEIIESKNSIKDLKNAFPIKNFRFSKKDLLLSQKINNSEVNHILNEIPNPNAVLNIISSLKSGEVNYFKLSENEYVVVGIEKIEKVSNSSPEFAKVISAYLANSTTSDVLPISLIAFKNNLKINIDQKLIDEMTKKEDERGND